MLWVCLKVFCCGFSLLIFCYLPLNPILSTAGKLLKFLHIQHTACLCIEWFPQLGPIYSPAMLLQTVLRDPQRSCSWNVLISGLIRCISQLQCYSIHFFFQAWDVVITRTNCLESHISFILHFCHCIGWKQSKHKKEQYNVQRNASVAE